MYSDAYDPLDGIAIIGMAGRFPDSPSVSALWQNLLAGRECITRFGPEELERPQGEAGDAQTRAHYVRARGVLEGVDEFDEEFFGLTPKEAAIVDPQQRLFLQAAWEAIEQSGHDAQRFDGPIGVFAGATTSSYYLQNLLSRNDVTDPLGPIMVMLGNSNDYVATRVSYKFDLKGPALNIQNACSTSLVAVCTAVQSLQTYQCDMALAGGVSIMLPQRRGYLHEEGSILAPDGHCRPFDRDAAGTVSSNGLGVVVLRRLRDAIEDGDTIYAVVKGSAVNNDGNAKVGFTAPSVDGHARVISMAQMLGGIDPATISYVEAHGTGTALGDPIEIAGLTQAFRTGGAEENGFCAIGSVKSNIGHLDVAAGVAGLIKTSLALHHRVLPASINFESPNPKLGIESTPFFVNADQRRWPEGPTPRRAGVSSFGLGGTNAHVVLEEAPSAGPAVPASRPAQLLVLSARDPQALDRVAHNLKDHLEQDLSADLADIAYTLQVGRRRFGHRRAVVCRDRDDAIALLTTADPLRVQGRGAPAELSGGVAFMFPGQGSQYVDMGRGLYESEPLFRETMDACARVLRTETGVDLLGVLYPGDPDRDSAHAQLSQTAITQPALFAIEYALAQVWMSWGVQPTAMIGHSIGEFVAACVGGTFSRDEALLLVAARARLMGSMPAGAMLGVRAPADLVTAELTPDVAIAAFNGPKHTVVSGPHDAIAGFEARLAAIGVAHRRLHTSHAYHSPMMEPAVQPFAELVAGTSRTAPALRWISSLTGRPITDAEACDPQYWARQLREPVQFATGVGALLDPRIALVEVGPGQTLSMLARQHERRLPEQLITTSLHPGQERGPDVDCLLAAAGRLWTRGADIDWHGLHGGTRRRVALPTYPFRRRRHWVDPSPGRESTQPAASPDPVPNSSASRSITPDSGDRSATLLAHLHTVFVELSGVDRSDLTPGASFLQMGFDSLFLTQAASALQKQFATTITVRTLVEEAPTFDLLIDHIMAATPDDTPDLAAPRILPAPVPAAPTRAPAVGLTDRQQQRLTTLIERHRWQEAVGPAIAVQSSGAYLRDAGGRAHIDLTNGGGAVFFGHDPAFIRDAIETEYASDSASGSPDALATEVAALVCEMVGMQRAAFYPDESGALTAAVHIARTRSGCDTIVAVTGAGHTVETVPGGRVVALAYGSAAALATIRSMRGELAGVLVEPVPVRRHRDHAPREFLNAVREVTAATGVALILDEVRSGFRTHPGGAQALFGVQSDIAVYGKVAGGGLPIGIVAGSAKYLDGSHAGGSPLALAAARVVLRRLRDDGPALQRGLNQRTTAFTERLRTVSAELDAPVHIRHFSSWFDVSFPPGLPLEPLYHALMRARGVHTREDGPGFLTLAHTDADLECVVSAFGESLAQMRADGVLPERAATPRRGRDAHGREAWFVPDPDRPGKYLQVVGASVGEEMAHG
ncbi:MULTISPECIES: type I polyketide synthase [Mycobacteriaceae]|uniref:Beta-ketoacyl synthase n=1 Tax=Mycolicibacterium neoaurum VKM Ac-1815D TaxID=700508 RepID=V5XHI2_MYCNE|nr:MULTISPECIES: type I polyketide synthase [Mycobacteriaceae]AHC27482.1 hypothetical protein D174_24325 [Mycolicibacterium neoaurum VKM Ac-1815D]AMO07689.1 hypothetical protein MyAD_23865 [Mycolicibacterium neoaurum]AXK73917.1 type I polyketide synthase [Mycolicibacterium neoaurum]KJQ51641.1 hypothetical protein TS71_02445 [Mycolicibacterium neoaurum]KUM06322.1 hypothetical protein AVZ31_22410 [Mycolicibacterium neoaurum]